MTMVPRKPSKLNSYLKDRILLLYKSGKTTEEISRLLHIPGKSIEIWKGQHADFKEAVEEAEAIADDLVEASLFMRATGYTHKSLQVFYNAKEDKVVKVPILKHYPPDVEAQKFWLKNRRPDEWQDKVVHAPHMGAIGSALRAHAKVSFQEFCKNAGYPEPYVKQIEMMEFGMNQDQPRLLLGSRGYGKTDYVVVLGLAYKIYLNQLGFRALIVTKSEERNAAMLNEIANACEANGVVFEKRSGLAIRVQGLIGKDHSVSSVTIGSSSIRGRHPDLIVMDDPVTEEDVSPATRKRVQRVYNELNKLVKNILVIGQPVHKSDLYETLRPLLRRMEVPHGSIPELDHDLIAMKLAGVSEESISASYHLKVVSENPTPFENVKFIDQFPPNAASVAFIDPSFEGGDYTAMSIGTSLFDSMAVKGRVWKKAWNICIDDIVQEVIKSNVKRICFETNSLGDMPIELLRKAVPAGVGVVGRKSNGNKHSRIMTAGMFAENIHLSKDSDRKYIEQVTGYEYKAEFDDAPDSLASLLAWLGLIRGKDTK